MKKNKVVHIYYLVFFMFVQRRPDPPLYTIYILYIIYIYCIQCAETEMQERGVKNELMSCDYLLIR